MWPVGYSTITWHVIIGMFVLGEHKSITSLQHRLFTLVHPATKATTDTCLFLSCWTNLICQTNKGGRISISRQWMWYWPPTWLLLLGWAQPSMIHWDIHLRLPLRCGNSFQRSFLCQEGPRGGLQGRKKKKFFKQSGIRFKTKHLIISCCLVFQLHELAVLNKECQNDKDTRKKLQGKNVVCLLELLSSTANLDYQVIAI